MALPRIWLLNFDADDELARRASTLGHTPRAAVLRRFAPLVDRIGLVPDGDVVVEEWNAAWKPPEGTFEARAFCPTPRALRALERLGARVPPAPPLDVLRRVNHRAFNAELGACLPLARYVRNRDELLDALAAGKGPWVLKRPFGFAGRGRQRLRSSELDASVEPFVRVSFETGEGLQVEPWVERTLDVGLHGFLARSGTATIGLPTRQKVDDAGAWIESVQLESGSLTRDEESMLLAEGERVAGALRDAGYFGPFGIDGFRWQSAGGGARFDPRCEINARYSMGWAVGMAGRRRDLDPQLSDGNEVG
jgi:hypothetical protein